MIRKHKAFTLAELLVIMAVLAILMAAFAPMFTSRYTSTASDSVWSVVPTNTSATPTHAYTDSPNKLFTQQSFIGITPDTAEAARTDYAPVSKVVIRSNLNQSQFDFYNAHNGNPTLAAKLSAQNNNLLLSNLNSVGITNLQNNTVLGIEAFSKKGNNSSDISGNDNTILGYKALYFHQNYNSETSNITAIGRYAINGFSPDIDINNSVVITDNYGNFPIKNDSVFIGDSANDDLKVDNHGEKTVFISMDHKSDNLGGRYTSQIGEGNVVVGYGAAAGKEHDISYTGFGRSSYSVVIGIPTLFGSWPYTSYSVPPGQYNTGIGAGYIGKPKRNGSELYPANNYTFIGSTSLDLDEQIPEEIFDVDMGDHVFAMGPSLYNGTTYPSLLEVHSFRGIGSLVIINGNLIVRGQTFMKGTDNKIYGHTLHTTAGSFKPFIGLDGNEHIFRGKDASGFNNEKYTSDSSTSCVCGNKTDYNMNACCPQLSDARLKNIGSVYTSGLEQLQKLKVYNYSYKTEGKTPTHVGVIAQDLKRIFPNAVTKDENGYYKIRWDEMFYAAINAVKELNTKVNNLIAKINSDKQKIKALKQEHQQLEKELDNLSNEIAKLENKLTN